MKKLIIVVLVSMVCSLSQGAVVMGDGLEAAETLVGNGWAGSWNFSGGNFGNPANYMYSGGDKGTVTKDTGYAIQFGDELELVFDIRDMEGGRVVTTGEQVIGTLFYNDGASDVVLGSIGYDDGDIPGAWNDGLGGLKVIAPAASVGHDLQVSFEYTYVGGVGREKRYGIDNVAVSAVLVPEPTIMCLLGLGGLVSLKRKK